MTYGRTTKFLVENDSHQVISSLGRFYKFIGRRTTDVRHLTSCQSATFSELQEGTTCLTHDPTLLRDFRSRVYTQPKMSLEFHSKRSGFQANIHLSADR